MKTNPKIYNRILGNFHNYDCKQLDIGHSIPQVMLLIGTVTGKLARVGYPS
jgi:hypothetical protein